MNTHPSSILRENERVLLNGGGTTQTTGTEYVSPSPVTSTASMEAARNYQSKALDFRTNKKDSIVGGAHNHWSNNSSNNSITDAENFLLDSFAMRGGADARTTKAAKTTGIVRPTEPHRGHVGLSSASKNPSGTQTDTASTSSTLSYLSPQEVIDFLVQRKLFLIKQKSDEMAHLMMGQVTPHGAVAPPPSTTTASLRRPTINQVGLHIDSDYFLDGKELERNVVIDYASDRSYVYTTDLQAKWMLPEFLFLDVPNSTYAARACGQFITNKLIVELNQMVKPGSSLGVLDDVLKKCNKSDYEVQNIYVPRRQAQYQHRPNNNHAARQSTDPSTNTTPTMDIPVQAITAKFRLRFARNGTNIHKMLYHNFMNGQACPRGILVFIPSMETGSPADDFWGSLKDVEGLPQVNECITNGKMDRWCFQIAQHHGTYRGKDPELLGLAVRDRDGVGPYSKNAGGTWTKRNSTTNAPVKRTPSKKKATKKVGTNPKKLASAKKKATPKKKTTTKSLSKTKRYQSKSIPEKEVEVKIKIEPK